MDIKDIEVGKTYRFAGPEGDGYQERGTIVVTSTTNEIGPWAIEGDATLEHASTLKRYAPIDHTVKVLLFAHEVIEEVV